ncbi:AbiTii domain-containing protein [Thermomonospora amylolytica]|uniref:AbiTii domain-containing protein n=1 Tax=Thermomonospora amylolytica TaxID=1411117 RepID=UPI00130025F0|nr:hypothetical protein [Thermomonospora amylolytica]
MSQDARDLLEEIERDALDSTVPIADVLRKCIVLGRYTDSTALRDWARRELRGYESETDLPAYRKVNAPICLDAIVGLNHVRGQQISPRALPEAAQEAGISERVPLLTSISEIASLANADGSPSVSISLPGASTLVALMNHEMEDEFQQILSLYWRVNRNTLKGLVDQVRSALVELVTEVINELPPGERTPAKTATDQALNVAVYGGKRNTVTLINAQAGGDTSVEAQSLPSSPSQETETWWHRWRKRGIVVGASTFVAAVVAIFTWVEWKPWQ